MNQIRLLVCLSTSLCCLVSQASDDVPLLPATASDPVSVTALPSRLLSPFSLELKGQGMANWQRYDSATSSGRLSARLFGQGDIGGPFGLELNTRLRTQGNSREEYRAEKNIRLDIQSLAFNYSPTSEWRWVAGRTNIRNGVASGFNPTDWFKDNSQVVFDSLDTADRREDRLGVVALMGIWLNEESVLSFGYRPDLHVRPETVAGHSDVVGLGLDRTNNKDAVFIKYTPSPAAWNNMALTVNSLYQKDQPGVGAELSFTVRDNLVLYSEWFSQRRQSLIDETIESAGDRMRYYHQLASGFSWSLPESLVAREDISFSVEYHINQAGINQSQLGLWRQAIADGDRPAAKVGLLAGEKQEPLAKQQYFGRLAWNDFWQDNDLSLITTVTPMDGSGFSQLTLSAPVMPALRVDLQGYHYFGNANTIYGSSGREKGFMISLVYTI